MRDALTAPLALQRAIQQSTPEEVKLLRTITKRARDERQQSVKRARQAEDEQTETEALGDALNGPVSATARLRPILR